MRSKEPLLDAAGFAALTNVSRETLARFEAYAGLLRRWSPAINLVGRDSLDDIWRRHFLDSAELLDYLPAGAETLVDLGSGAGFPGLVLAMLGVPRVTLIEADVRKATFLREAARITDSRVEIRTARIDAVPAQIFDVVSARACAPLDQLLSLSERFIGGKTRCLFLKGARVEEELTAARRDWTIAASCHRSRSDPRGVVLSLDQVAREPHR
ncbi:MAG TPA: 16S rRNA (guanine(527)-N(7))-methyltransferase RsmG [Stellaceae bacterium]|nr:16S rRNA (guanine(527)-N(7))-methyltransferase RsmG [Stellaceae bacterium]